MMAEAPLKIDYQEEGSCLRHLEVEIPLDTVAVAFEQRANQYSRKLKLPGFRRGKIPRELVRTRFRGEIMNEVAQDLVPKALEQALGDRSLRPVGEPSINQLEAEFGKPLKFRASFEIMPALSAKNYRGLQVDGASIEVTDEDVDLRIDALRDQAATLVPIEERGARDGDFVQANLIEQPARGPGPVRKQDGILIEVGSDTYHPRLHETLQGVMPGATVSVEVDFPADHADRERAGKNLRVELEVKELKTKVLPALDDEFAKDLGEFDSLDELKTHLRSQAEAEAKQKAERDFREQLFQKLLQANPIEAPRALVEAELDRRLEQFIRGLVEQGMDPKQSGMDWAALRESQRESALASVQTYLLLDAIVEQENLKESEEDVDREIEQTAARLKRGTEAVRAQLLKEGGLDRLRHRLRREKAVDLLSENARIQKG